MAQIAIIPSDTLSNSLADLFGVLAREAVVEPAPLPATMPLTADPLFHLFAIGLLLLWVMLIYAYRAEIQTLFRSVILVKNTSLDDSNHIFASLTHRASLLALLCGAMLLTYTLENHLGVSGESLQRLGAMAVPVIGLILATVLLIQGVIIYAVARLCSADEMRRYLSTIKHSTLDSWAITISLPTLLLVLNHGGSEGVIFNVVVLISLLFVLLFVYKTLLLFRGAKISILIWILYLCSVELLPLTIFLVAPLRQM